MLFVWVSVRYKQTPSVPAAPSSLSFIFLSISPALPSVYDLITVLEGTTSKLGERNQGREG